MKYKKDRNAVALGKKGGRAVANIPGHLDRARAIGWLRRRERRDAKLIQAVKALGPARCAAITRALQAQMSDTATTSRTY